MKLPRLSGSFLPLRPFFILSVFLIEVVFVTSTYTLSESFSKINDKTASYVFLSSKEYWRLALWIVGSIVFLLSPYYEAIFNEWRATIKSHNWKRWLLFQLVTFFVFVYTTDYLFIRINDLSEITIIKATAWLTIAGMSFIFWIVALASPGFWLCLVKTYRYNMLGSVLLGLYCWFLYSMLFDYNVPLWQDKLWLHLSQYSLTIIHWLLSLFYSDLMFFPDYQVIGTSTYYVEVTHYCSGIEGITLISIFLTIYFWLFRKHLRFPHVFLLYPIGIVGIWLANSVRIAALIALGSSYSSEVAQGAFHAQAGWIIFTLFSMAAIAMTHRSRLFAQKQSSADESNEHAVLAAALLAPFLVQLTASIISSAFSSSFDQFYPLKILLIALTIFYFRRQYANFIAFKDSWPHFGIFVGVIVFILWIFLVDSNEKKGLSLYEGLNSQTEWMASTWLIFRILGSSIIVPIAEELAFRGYLMRKLVATDFENVSIGQFSWLSFIVSSLCFGFLHDDWFAGTLAGMGYAIVVYKKGNLGDAIAAHMTTNILIAITVLRFDQWSLWS